MRRRELLLLPLAALIPVPKPTSVLRYDLRVIDGKVLAEVIERNAARIAEHRRGIGIVGATWEK